ncbi:copper oxidase [Arthrobacter stackebrandtii]|nr:copper oxidase [Arthrobacter stackebrandtii]
MWSMKEVRPGIRVGFTDTTAGNLAFHVGDDPARVAEHRAAVAAVAAAAGGSIAWMNQVHGAHTAVVAGGEQGSAAPTADAMVLDPANVSGPAAGLAVMVADCVPVVLVGTGSGGEPLLGVAHAGRPGVEAGVIDSVVSQLQHAGAAGIEAWLGPSICGSCYEVPEDMRASVAARVPQAHATTSWGTPALDLPAAVLAQLRAHGVTAHASGICTLEDSRYYSHRRSQRDGEPEGRFIGLVTATPRP